MTTFTKTVATALSMLGVALTGAITASDAEAKGSGRQVHIERYDSDQPLHGYEGPALGGYYCSYVRIPKRRCSGSGGHRTCRVTGWTLRQECR